MWKQQYNLTSLDNKSGRDLYQKEVKPTTTTGKQTGNN